MSTQIDSLSIQISTSAGQAVANIERLATALEGLKTSSKLTTVITNLNKLNTAVAGVQSTSNAVNKIRSLSGALNGLQNVPKLTNITSFIRELNKIPATINGLNANALDLFSVQLHRVATSLSGLSSVPNLNGFTSAIRALNMIPSIVGKLDSATLDKFTRQIKKLSTALAPLAKQITAISTGFSKLPQNITRAASATNSMTTATNKTNKALNTGSINLMATISNYTTLYHTLNMVIQMMAKFLADAIEWDGIQFRFGRAFGEDAEETYKYIVRLNDALGINIQQFMQYSSLYGSLLKGFGMGQEKVTTISTGLTELSYDIWSAYNDRYKTLEDASEAVRSAITGEIEPIRNAGIALTEASLQEYIDSTHLAGISIEKLSEAQKAEVRYAAMVNAAMNQGIVGTYAREMNTAEGAVRSLSQSFKSLVQAFGSLFIPVLQIVVPYITAFVELLTEAVFWVANLFGIPIQEIDWGNATSGIGGVADSAKEATEGLDSASKAAKKLKDYTLGFDELNVISPDKGSGSGGGAGKGGGAAGWGDGLDLDTLWDESVFEQASKRVDEIKSKVKGFVADWGWALGIVGTILTGLMVHKAWGTILTWGSKIALAFGTVTSIIRAVWGTFRGSTAAASALAMLSPKLSAFVTAIKTAATTVVTFIAGLTGPMWAVIIATITAVASTAYFLYENWEKVVKIVKDFFKENIAPKLDEIKKHFGDMVKALGPFGEAIKKAYKSVKDFIKNIDWSKLDWIGKVFEFIGGVIFSVVGGVIATAFNIFVGWIENIVQVITGFVQIASGVIQAVVALFKGDFSKIENITKLISDGLRNVWDGMVGLLLNSAKGLIEGIAGWFNELSEKLLGKTVPELIKSVVDWFLSLPKKILKPIQDFVNSIVTKFKNMWSDIKKWFNENVAPKFTSKYWKDFFQTVVDSVSSKLKEAKSSIEEKWKGITEWFNTNVKPKFTSKYWKDFFQTVIDGASSKLSEVKTTIEGKWGEVKAWYDKNVAPKFTTSYWKGEFDSLRSGLKEKLDEAWKEVKNFFSASEWKKKVEDAVKAIKDNFKMPEFKKIKLDVTFSTDVGPIKTAVYKALGLSGWPSLKWSTYAMGGMPSMGEMFIAREAGPELVGRIGNKSAVVNNDQIVAAVSQGVYTAVVSAMSGGGNGGQAVNVYLDGKQIYASVKKAEAQKGANIFGNQLEYGY